jgi:hypothetical protein
MKRQVIGIDLSRGEDYSALSVGEINENGATVIHTTIIGDTPEKERQIREIVELERMAGNLVL